MKSNDYYHGRLPAEEYKGVLSTLVMYPRKEDFVSYRIIMPNGDIDEGVTRAYIENMKLNIPTERTAVVETKVPDVGNVIVQWNLDEKAFKQAKYDYGIQTSILQEKFRQDLRNEYLPDHMLPYDHIIYDSAYDRGHSAGYSEISSYYGDIVDFVEQILKIKSENA